MLTLILGVITCLLIIGDCFFISQIKKNKTKSQELKTTIDIQNESIRNLINKHDNELNEYNILLSSKIGIENGLKASKAEYETIQEHCRNANQEFQEKAKLMDSVQKDKEQKLIAEYNNLCFEQEERLGEVSRDFLIQWKELTDKLVNERNMLSAQVEQERITLNAAVKAAKRAQLEQSKKDYYRIMLDSAAAADIKQLRSIESSLVRPEALNKIIWKVYYENPTSDMIGRVVGNSAKTGIYKITHCESGMAYIGQSNDISARFKQHIKRGLGADTPTQNKLYPAMKKFGPEAFMFEILEECDRNKMDEREDYWQDFYKVKEFGFSIK